MPDVLSSAVKSKVTSLKFVGDRILAGISGDIHIFSLNSANTFEPTFKTTVFPVQSIHGISNKNEHILVFGGKELALLYFCRNNDIISKIYDWRIQDWILDVTWLTKCMCVAVITAHNTVIQFDLQNRSPICTVSCEERCILYSAKLIKDCLDDVVVLAGTVFQEIVIWTSLGLSSSSNIQPVLHKLRGHKGVIFNVDYDAKCSSICSTSDDRTVRIWSVTFSDPLHTTLEKWKTAEISLKHTIFGHTARVWRSRFLSDERVVSIGEDSFVCIWDQYGKCKQQWSGHQGGVIWAVDCSEELGFIATGGNDCGITLWPLHDYDPPSPLQINSFSNKELFTPKILSLTSNGNVVTTTECGCIMIYANECWKIWYRDDRFSSYCVQSMSPLRRKLALGSIKGDIIIASVYDGKFKQIVDYNGTGRKIFSLLWVNETMFVTCENEGLVFLWELKESQGFVTIQTIGKFILPPSKERWITSALLHSNNLLCGDRMGSVHLFIIQHDIDISAPVHSLLKLHGVRGVTSLLYVSNNVISTGRDGTVRRLIVHDSSLQLVSTSKLQMDWAANVEYTKLFGLLVTGFHNVYFVVWSMVEQRYLLKIDCGGGHRSWDYMMDEECLHIGLIFIKNKDVHHFHNPLSRIYCCSPLIGYHTKTINTGCILPLSNSGKVVILTGSEDTTLRISRISGNMFLKSEAILRNHISSIRTVYCLLSLNDNKIYLFSAGGRGQIKVWQLSITDNDEISAVELASHMVRNESKRHWLKAMPLPDPETRYMDLTAVEINPPQILIIAACSDGMLRFLEFDSVTLKLNICNVLEFHQHCILKVLNFKINHNIIAASMATDGKVAFWNASKILSQDDDDKRIEPFGHFRLHDLGINSCAFQCQDEYLILATGSDDTTVKVNAFKFDADKSANILSTWSNRQLHYCQVTGAFMTQKFIFTAGLDQQMNMLRWSYTNYILDVMPIYRFVSCISDIHGLIVWSPLDKVSEMNIGIFGDGVQLISLKDFI